MKRKNNYLLIFIVMPILFFAQKGLDPHNMNYGTKLSYRDFYIFFNGKSINLNKDNRIKLQTLINDYNSIKTEYKYNSLWINCALSSNKSHKYNRIQKKRCFKVLYYLTKINQTLDSNYTLNFVYIDLPIEKKENNFIEIIYDEK